MGDSPYTYTGNTIDRRDAEHYFATWAADDLAELRELWSLFSLTDLAMYFKRTEASVYSMYHKQANRPIGERFTPATKTARAWDGEEQERKILDTRPVHTEADEDRWWEPDYYRSAG